MMLCVRCLLILVVMRGRGMGLCVLWMGSGWRSGLWGCWLFIDFGGLGEI